MKNGIMKVAILMEQSGVIRRAFRKNGHDAISVDLLPSIDKSLFHHKMDVIDFLNRGRVHYDLIIAHPSCTAMCVSGNHVYAKEKTKWLKRVAAIKYTQNLWNLCKRTSTSVCFENPVGVLTTMSDLPKPQYIQPYQFNEDASKKTCLFLHNLEKLKINPLDYFQPRVVNGLKRWGNQTDSGQNKLGPSSDRWKKRSETYQGIADAMANQWG